MKYSDNALSITVDNRTHNPSCIATPSCTTVAIISYIANTYKIIFLLKVLTSACDFYLAINIIATFWCGSSKVMWVVTGNKQYSNDGHMAIAS